MLFKVVAYIMIQGFLAYLVDKYSHVDSIFCYLYLLQLFVTLYYMHASHKKGKL